MVFGGWGGILGVSWFVGRSSGLSAVAGLLVVGGMSRVSLGWLAMFGRLQGSVGMLCFEAFAACRHIPSVLSTKRLLRSRESSGSTAIAAAALPTVHLFSRQPARPCLFPQPTARVLYRPSLAVAASPYAGLHTRTCRSSLAAVARPCVRLHTHGHTAPPWPPLLGHTPGYIFASAPPPTFLQCTPPALTPVLCARSVRPWPSLLGHVPGSAFAFARPSTFSQCPPPALAPVLSSRAVRPWVGHTPDCAFVSTRPPTFSQFPPPALAPVLSAVPAACAVH